MGEEEGRHARAALTSLATYDLQCGSGSRLGKRGLCGACTQLPRPTSAISQVRPLRCVHSIR